MSRCELKNPGNPEQSNTHAEQAAGVSASHEPQNCRARNNWQGVLNRTLEPYLGQNMMAAGGFFSYSYQGIAVEKDLLDLFVGES